jgi:signal transduction histidine kinase
MKFGTAADEAPPRGSPLTVAGWQNLVLAIVGVLIVGGAIGGNVLLRNSDNVANQLINEVQPARSAAYRLQAALRDQETAVRGYAISADRQFLDPYYTGRDAEQQAADDIRQLAGSRKVLADDVDAIEAAAATWRTTFAEPLVASITPGTPIVVDPALSERGKVEFDRIRALFDSQNDHLTQARADGLAQLESIKTWRNGVLIGMVIVVLVAALALAVIMRSAITRPLVALAAACRRTTEGNFTDKIAPRGPKDIRAIASDIDDMRQRIVDELEASHTARGLLEAQTAALDEQAAELRRSNAELEQFAYVASHDLQEPLRKVAAFCQLLERRYGDKLDERGVEYIGFAVDGAKRMQALINDLLTFSRVGRLNAAYSEVSLDTTLARAVENLATAIEESGAEIVRPEGHLPTVNGDATLLAMVWQNLVGNAVKFRREGLAPRIVIECTPGMGDRRGQWVFTVTDNGIGIPEEFADKVFVIFQRLHVRDAYAGTGIGLALCKKIVEHHGGTIWIDTTYTAGTRFRFTLPDAANTVALPKNTPAASMEGSTR